MKTPIGYLSSVTPRESARSVRPKDTHLGGRAGLGGTEPKGWTLSREMDLVLRQSPQRPGKDSKPPFKSMFGVRASKKPELKQTIQKLSPRSPKRIGCRQGPPNHRIFNGPKSPSVPAPPPPQMKNGNAPVRSPKVKARPNATYASPSSSSIARPGRKFVGKYNNEAGILTGSMPPNQPKDSSPWQGTDPAHSSKSAGKNTWGNKSTNMANAMGIATYEAPDRKYSQPTREERDVVNKMNRERAIAARKARIEAKTKQQHEGKKNQKKNGKYTVHREEPVTLPSGEIFRPALGGVAEPLETDRGHVRRWSQSMEAPEWMVKQNRDKSALLKRRQEDSSGWATHYHREHMEGTVSDNTISGEAPAWMVDQMERSGRSDLILRKNSDGHWFTNKGIRSKGFEASNDYGTFDSGAGGAGGSGLGITDSTVSGDMPTFFTEANERIDRDNIRHTKPSWFNRQGHIRSSTTAAHKKSGRTAAMESDEMNSMALGDYSLGGVRSFIDFGNGVQITDSSVSGDAPTWMVEMSERVDDRCVVRRPNNQLNFVNKSFTQEIEKTGGFAGQAWTDSTVSGDAPSWMTEQNDRVDPRIVRSHPKSKRTWRNKYAPESYRKFPHTKHIPQVRDPRGRTKTKKRWKDGRTRKQEELTMKETYVSHKVKRAPQGPVMAGGSVSSTATTAGKGSTYRYA